MLKNIIKVLISNIVVMFTSFINTLIIPKLISIEGYAEYQTFMLYISYVGLLTFGFPAGLFVKYGGTNKEALKRNQYKSEIRILIWSQIIISVIVMGMGLLTKNILLICTVPCILSVNFVSVYKYLYQAWDMFTAFSIVSIVQSLGYSVLVLILGVINGKLYSKDVIFLYIGINILCFAVIFIFYLRENWSVPSNPMISLENFETLKVGFLLILGSGANVIFHSIDKFFIKGFFSAYEFSIYCFAFSLLNVMNVFINAIAQPMYLRLVSNLDNIQERKNFKEILLCFGGFSGCAYYAVSVIVRYFIPEYIESLQIVVILFAIFPAVAVINCLYINLYKATGKIKKYLCSLVVIIICAVILNGIGLLISRSYLSITAATTICYYFWLFFSSKDFEGLLISLKDIIYLIGFLIIFMGLTRIPNTFIGFFIYIIFIFLWDMFIYKENIKNLCKLGLQLIKKH